MIDKKKDKTNPDLKEILKTCRRNITKSELQQIINSFKSLYKKHDIQISGFSIGQDQCGLNLTKIVTIAQEHRQREKVFDSLAPNPLTPTTNLISKERNEEKKQEANNNIKDKLSTEKSKGKDN